MHFVSNSSLPVQYFISVYISLSNRVKSIKKGTNRILRLILYKTSLHMSERERGHFYYKYVQSCHREEIYNVTMIF